MPVTEAGALHQAGAHIHHTPAQAEPGRSARAEHFESLAHLANDWVKSQLPDKAVNKHYGMQVPERKMVRYGTEALIDRNERYDDDRENSDIHHVTSSNCTGQSFLARKHLREQIWEKEGRPTVPIDSVKFAPPYDHHCTVIGQAPVWGRYPKDFSKWSKDAVICDPWANIVCPAREYPARWQEKMQKWSDRGLQIGGHLDEDDHIEGESPLASRWLDAPVQADKEQVADSLDDSFFPVPGLPPAAFVAARERAEQHIDLLNQVDLPLDNRRVLHVGCGHGELAAALQDFDAQVYGVEPDARQAHQAIAQGHIDAKRMFQGPLGEMAAHPDGKFDVAMAVDMDLARLDLPALGRSLTPQGTVVLSLADPQPAADPDASRSMAATLGRHFREVRQVTEENSARSYWILASPIPPAEGPVAKAPRRGG